MTDKEFERLKRLIVWLQKLLDMAQEEYWQQTGRYYEVFK